MMSTIPEHSPLPISDPDRVGRVRDVLDGAGYTWPGVRTLLGDTQTATLKFDLREVPRLLRLCAGGSPLETLARLFMLGASVDEDRVRQAVAPMAVEDWVDLRLLGRADGRLFCPFRITPSDELLLVQEAPWRPGPLATQVMSVSGSTMSLVQLLIRRPVGAALDLGSGCGVLALLAARNSERAAGVDCNPRAVSLATFNAHLNRLPNAQFLLGDLFEPVQDQTFDLIVVNPPYVISPVKQVLFRDSGLPGDGISARIVQAVPRFLRPGGFAQVLINWAQVKGQDWRERMVSWLEGSDCDAWLLRFETVTPDKYTSTWLPREEDPEAHGRRFEEWMTYYESQGIEAIGSGLITLHRRSSGPGWFAYDDAPGLIGPCGEAVVRGFEQRDFLARNADDQALLAARYRLNPAVQGEQQLKPAPASWQQVSSRVHLSEGLAFNLKLDALGMNLLTHIQPARPLSAVLTELAARLGQEPAKLFAGALPFVRCLIEQEFLLPVGISKLPADTASGSRS